MSGPGIAQVNQKLSELPDEFSTDPLIWESLHLQIATFGGQVDIIPFVPISQFRPPKLSTCGGTPMPEAILASINETERQKAFLNETEAYVRTPHYFLLTDGQATSPSSVIEAAKARIRQCEQDGTGAFYAFATDEYAVQYLRPLFPRKVHLLANSNFAGFFKILSLSVRQVSQTTASERLDLTSFIDVQFRLLDDR
jgi:uncharacterized protein YegL